MTFTTKKSPQLVETRWHKRLLQWIVITNCKVDITYKHTKWVEWTWPCAQEKKTQWFKSLPKTMFTTNWNIRFSSCFHNFVHSHFQSPPKIIACNKCDGTSKHHDEMQQQ